MSRRPQCPWWCGDHSDSDTISYPHHSQHDHVPLGSSEHGFVTAYTAGSDSENDNEPPAVAVAVTAVVHRDPEIDVRLLIHDPNRARDLALLVESLDHATPGQHRVLAAQIRTAAGIVKIAREDALRATSGGSS